MGSLYTYSVLIVNAMAVSFSGITQVTSSHRVFVSDTAAVDKLDERTAFSNQQAQN